MLSVTCRMQIKVPRSLSICVFWTLFSFWAGDVAFANDVTIRREGL